MTEITNALTHLRAGCHEEVTQTGGSLDACGRVAVAAYRFPGSDQAEPSVYPVCARHVRRQCRMIPLADLLAEVWDQSYLAEVEHKATSNPYRKANQ